MVGERGLISGISTMPKWRHKPSRNILKQRDPREFTFASIQLLRPYWREPRTGYSSPRQRQHRIRIFYADSGCIWTSTQFVRLKYQRRMKSTWQPCSEQKRSAVVAAGRLPRAIVADSGNGAHLHFPISLNHDAKSTALIKAVTQAVAERFTDKLVKIDEAVFNAARICRLYGTWSRKGDSTDDRPHRRSGLIHVPDYLRGGWNESDAARVDVLTTLASKSRKVVSVPSRQSQSDKSHHDESDGQFDLRQMLVDRGIDFREAATSAEYPVKLHLACPFNENHIHKDSYVAQHKSGALVFHCSHASCAHKQMAGVQGPRRHRGRLKLEEWETFRRRRQFKIKAKESNRRRLQAVPLSELPQPLGNSVAKSRKLLAAIHHFLLLWRWQFAQLQSGQTRQVFIKGGWSTYCLIWTMIIGRKWHSEESTFPARDGSVEGLATEAGGDFCGG